MVISITSSVVNVAETLSSVFSLHFIHRGLCRVDPRCIDSGKVMHTEGSFPSEVFVHLFVIPEIICLQTKFIVMEKWHCFACIAKEI